MAVAATLEAEPMEAAAARAAVGLAEARSVWRKCHERRRSKWHVEAVCALHATREIPANFVIVTAVADADIVD